MANICIVTHSLGNGGAQRSSALLSITLKDIGHDPFIVCMENQFDYAHCGEVLHLYQHVKSNMFTRKFNKFIALRKFLKENNIVAVIENRTRNNFFNELVFRYFAYRSIPIIYTVRNHNLEKSFPKTRFLAKLLYARANRIVCVSKDVESHVKATYNLKNTLCIYNTFVEEAINPEKIEKQPFIFTYGRIVEEQKNFTLLFNAFFTSKLWEKGIKLIVMGKGNDLEMLKSLCKDNNIPQIEFLDYNPAPWNYVKNAHFVALTSRYEGFGRVLLESLSYGTPVVSVDCKSGPSEIVKNGINGLLVENHSVQKLADAFVKMFEDDALYNTLRLNAKQSVVHMGYGQIKTEWENCLNDVLKL